MNSDNVLGPGELWLVSWEDNMPVFSPFEKVAANRRLLEDPLHRPPQLPIRVEPETINEWRRSALDFRRTLDAITAHVGVLPKVAWE